MVVRCGSAWNLLVYSTVIHTARGPTLRPGFDRASGYRPNQEVEALMSNSKIRIEATIQAAPAKVWAHWTEPKHITQWNFAIPEWHCPSASNDLKVGGKYSARMEAKDGSFGFDFEGIYSEIVEQKKLVYKMEDGREVTTTFESHGGSTKAVTVFDAEKQNPEEMQKSGWQSILDNFKKYSEAN